MSQSPFESGRKRSRPEDGKDSEEVRPSSQQRQYSETGTLASPPVGQEATPQRLLHGLGNHQDSVRNAQLLEALARAQRLQNSTLPELALLRGLPTSALNHLISSGGFSGGSLMSDNLLAGRPNFDLGVSRTSTTASIVENTNFIRAQLLARLNQMDSQQGALSSHVLPYSHRQQSSPYIDSHLSGSTDAAGFRRFPLLGAFGHQRMHQLLGASSLLSQAGNYSAANFLSSQQLQSLQGTHLTSSLEQFLLSASPTSTLLGVQVSTAGQSHDSNIENTSDSQLHNTFSSDHAAAAHSTISADWNTAISVTSSARSNNMANPPVTSPVGANASASVKDDNPKPSIDSAILLYTPADDTNLSAYQCLSRKQIEFFEAQESDLEAGCQGRNKPIVFKQVGIRCRHCAHLPFRQKNRASTYYPSKVVGVYQAAQNITNTHLNRLCHCIPENIRLELVRLQAVKAFAGGGKKYWAESTRALGICDTDEGGLRFERIIQGKTSRLKVAAQKDGSSGASSKAQLKSGSP